MTRQSNYGKVMCDQRQSNMLGKCGSVERVITLEENFGSYHSILKKSDQEHGALRLNRYKKSMIKGKKLKNSVKIGYNFPLKSWTEFFNEI